MLGEDERALAPTVAVLLVLLLVGSALLLLAQRPLDPLAQFRAPDGSLHIPGGALTPELQRLIFGGNDLQPVLNLSRYVPARSPYPTADLVPRPYLTPNPNVVVRPNRPPQTLAEGIARIVARWFPPVDWGAGLRDASRWFFGLFLWDARAITAIDTTTVTDVVTAANTCTTTQTTGAIDNAVLVLLSERGITSFSTVTYGSQSLTLITNTGANGANLVRSEIWGFAGTLPAGSQTMTATLTGGLTSKMTCATVLLQGVRSSGAFINGTSSTANSTNATVTLTAAVSALDLGFAVATIQNTGGAGAQPTAVSGTGAVATDVYGVAIAHCTGGGAANECAAGADIVSPGTAITWTNPKTTWVVSAVEVVGSPTCGTIGGANCYRINNGGAWSNTNNWSNAPGGTSCGCTPIATDFAIFNTNPTGTTTLSAATTVAGIDMTGFTGALDTSNANSWALTVNGDFTIQGTFLPRGSAVVVTGNVMIVSATTVITMSTSAWTVSGTWTNNSTAGTWSAGTGSVTIVDAASGTLTFGNLGVNEFNNLTLDASATGGLTYTMAANPLRVGGTLLIRNSAAGATGATVLDTSASNLAVTVGALTIAVLGGSNTEASAVTVNGNVNISAATGFVNNTAGTWTVTGTWTDLSTSASWSFAAAMSFRAPASRAMTFGPQAGNEFAGTVTFDTSAAAGATYTMGTNPLDVGGLLTIRNSVGGATGAVILDTSSSNLGVTAGGLTLSTLGAFNTRGSTVTLAGSVNVSTGSGYIVNTAGSWTVPGSWTNLTASVSWSFAAAITFLAATPQSMIFAGSNLAGNEFGGAVTFDTPTAGGVTYTLAANATGDSSLRIGGTLTLRNTAGGASAATILDTSAGNYNLTAGSLILGTPRGALRSEGSVVTINGAVNIADTNSYLVLGSAAWTVAGSWTNGSTDGIDWSAGTGTLTFRDGANATMTFANLGVNEFNNAVFDSSLAAGMTYAMATNGLRVAGVITIQNTAASPTGNVVLSTGVSNLALTSGGIVLGTRGTLTANGSTITVNGSWTSTAANHVWNKGTSAVVFSASGTLTTSAGESFNTLTQSAGTTTLGSNVTVTGATSVNGTLDTSASNFTLTLQSTLAIGASGVLNLEGSTASTAGNVTIAVGGAVRFTGAGFWTINGSWTDANTTVPVLWVVGTSTVRFVGAAATTLTFWTAPGNEFNNLILDSSAAAGVTYLQVNPLQTAGILTVQNTAGSASGAVILDASASNYATTVGGLSLGPLGAYVSRSALVTVNGNVGIAANAYVTSAGAWIVTGSWTNGTTSASWSFLASVTFRSAANQTMTFKAAPTEFSSNVTFDTTNAAGTTYIMATNPLTLSGLLTVRNSVATPTGNTVLDTSAANLGISAGSVTVGTNGTLVAEGSTITVGGNWTVNAPNATFTPGTSTVVLTAAATVTMTQAFYGLTVAAGPATLATSLTVTSALTVSGGILAKGANTMTLGTLTLSGGGITSASGNVSVSGSVTISSAASYIAFGSETWTIGGSWTNGSMSASWSVGTGAVVFSSFTSQTMTFMAGSASEFYNVTFNSGASTATFTMATNGLRVANLLDVQGGAGTTTLSTTASNLPITSVSLTVAAGGALAANGSTITVRSMDTSAGSFAAGTSSVAVNASGGSVNVPQMMYSLTVNAGISTTFTSSIMFSGTLTLTSSTVTFSGNVTSSGAATITFASATVGVAGSWDTSSAGGFTSTSSGVSFTGASKTVNLAAGQSFASVSVSGTLTQLSQLTASSLTVSAGSLTKGTNPLTVNGNLALSGGALLSTSGAVRVTGNVNVSAAASFIAFGSEAWTISGSWTDASTSTSWSVGTATVTFATAVAQTMTFAGANLSGPEFNTLVFDSTVAAGVTYTMSTRGLNLSGSLTIQNTATNPTGNTILTTSAANLPIISTGTIATSATGTLTANASTISFQSLNTSSGTFNVGTSTLVAATTGGTINAPQTLDNVTVNASVTLSAASNLTIGGTLTVNGVFVTLAFNLTAAGLAGLSGGITAGASGAKTFGGNVTVNATGYFSLGGASWTFAGSWTNNSTSAAWSAGTAIVSFSSATGGTMTFAGSNLAGDEFATVVFASSAGTAQTFAMASRPLNAGNVQVNDASATTTLDTSAANLAITAGTVTVGANGTLNARGSVITITSIDTSAGTLTPGTSTVVVSASSGIVNVPQTLNNLTVNAGVSTTFASNLTWSGTLTLTSSTPTFNGNLTSSGAAAANFASATVSIAGSWDTASASSFTSTSSTVTFTGAAKTVRLAVGQSFASLVVTGTLSQASQLTTGSLTLSSGSLTKGTNALSVSGNVVLSGGALVSTSGNVSVSGNVSISSASSYIAFGSEAWTVAGAWTNASTSASWSAGSATVTFNSAVVQTMTFAGANLPGNEFNAVIFNSGSNAVTFTMSTRGLLAGTITVQGGTALTSLSTANLPLTATTLAVGGNGALTAGSSTITVQSINTSAGAFTAGISTIVVNASSGSINMPQTVYNLTVNPGVTTTAISAVTFNGTLTLTSASMTFNSDLRSSGASAAVSFANATLSVAGSWDTSVSSSNFTAASSSVTFSGVAASIATGAGCSFQDVTITGTLSQASPLTATSLTIASGSFAKGTNTLTVNGNLTLSGGVITSTSGSASIAGNVSVPAANSYIAFGSETWTVSGTWTNASTSASWAAGTGTVIFNPGASGSYTFGSLAGSEFNNVQFSPTASATLTMAGNGMRWAGALTLNTNATLTTGGLPLTGGSLTVGNGATLAANASTVNVTDVTMTGGTSGTIAATTGAWTVSGNWDTSGAGSTFTPGTSTVTLSGASKTVKLLSGQQFAALTVSGTVSMTSLLAAANLTVSGSLTKTGFNLTFNSLSSTTGSIIDGTVNVTSFAVTDSDPSAAITVTVFSEWTTDTRYAWTHTDSKTTDTITFTIGGQTGSVFNVYKNGTLFANGTVVGGNIAFTMTGSDPDVLVTPSGCGGNNRYWVLGTGNWSETSHWSSSSGGVGGCSLPGNTTNVIFDANSGTGTVTVDLDDSFATLNTTGSTIATIALGANSLTTTGSVTLAAGTLTIGASTATGLTVGGSLTLSGTAALDGSAAASVVNVAGNLTVSSAGAYLRMGSATWTVSGAWTNASTSASWATGTGTIVFNAAGSQTMTFAGANLPGPEFYNATFNSGASATTFTLSTRGLNVGNLLTIQGGTGVTTLDLSAANMPLTVVDIVVAANGVLNGRGSAIRVSGNWDSHLGTFTAGTSTVTLQGASKTVNVGSPFATLHITGTVSLASAVTAGTALAIDSNGLLDTSAANFALSVVSLTVGATGTLVAEASMITITSIDTHLGTFNVGTSAVVVNASGGTINISQTVHDLTINAGVTTSFSGSFTWSGAFTLTNAAVDFSASNLTSSGAATMSFASATITMGTGTWDTSSAATFTATGSSVTFSGTGSLALGTSAAFAAVTISGGIRTLVTSLSMAGLLTLSGGILAKGTNALILGAGLTLSGGALTSTAGAVTVTGDVNISAAASYIVFGSEAWTVSGSWTNASTSANWSVGTATVTFTSASSQTMDFASLPGGAPEFANITFNSGVSTTTFTLAGNALVWSGTLAILGGPGTTTLATSGLGLIGGALSVGNAGSLTASTSAVSVTNVTMAGGVSGAITLTTGAWTVLGNWDTSGAGSTFAAGTSTVTLSGAPATVNPAPGQAFYDLIITGTVSLSSAVTALATMTLGSGAVLTKTGQNLTFNGLVETGSGRIADGTITVANLTVTNSDPTNLTTISAFTAWGFDGEFRWTHTSTVPTSTLTFTIGGNTAGYRFNVTKDGSPFTTGFVDASGQVVFTMLGSDPVVDVIIAVPCGGTRYWVGGTGNWSDTSHWSATSGGAGGCPLPSPSSAVLFDANSGGGTATVDQNASATSLNTAGWAGILSIGTFNLAVGGNLALGGGILAVGASAGTGLTVGGNLTLTGSAILDGFGVPSIVSVTGDVSIASATAYVRMGSGTWTVGGSWSNASTAVNWSAGTGTVVFNSAMSETMTFASFAGNEFSNVTFASAGASGVTTFTLATNSLKWSGTLTIQDTSGSTTTLATAGLALSGGSLAVGNGGSLAADTSTVTLADVTMTGGTSGAITVTTGAWTVTGNWNTSGAGSTFAKGTGTVTMSGNGRTLSLLNAGNGFFNLTISGAVTASSAVDVTATLAITGTLTTAGFGLTGGAGLLISGGGTLDGSTSSIAVSSVAMNDGAANHLILTTGFLSVSGSWDTSGPASTFSAGTSGVALTAATGTLTLGASQAFAGLAISGDYTLTATLSAVSLTISAGSLSKGTYALALAGDLILTGGSLTSVSGDVAISGNVNVSAAASFIVFGSEAWTVSGSWTNLSSSASWSPGTGSMTFNSASPQTMTFAGTSLAGAEFNVVVFNGGAATVTFTLAGPSLAAHTIRIQGGTGTTSVSTAGSNLPIAADSLTVGAGGSLEPNGSVITLQTIDTSAGSFTAGTSVIVVNASGGSVRVTQVLYSLTVNPGITTAFASSISWSAILTLTGSTSAFAGNLTSAGAATLSFGAAVLTVAGSWDTSTAALFVASGSTVTFTGSGQTIALATGQAFASLIIAGTVTASSDVNAASLTVNPSSALTKTSHSLTFNSLTVNGTIVDGTVNVSNLTVTNSDSTALVTISAFTAWTVGSEYAWTHTSSETSQTITWTIGGNTSHFLFGVTKDGKAFTNGTVDDSGRVVFTMLGSDPAMRVTVSAPPWWTSPFFLAMLPIPFIVVTAMFVQRRRWRPAKAFLVDERGQLLREFTLDPSCQVSYDQAMQAGALDAVDKDVRVSKYHARAVRGDLLSLIMLAVGPANIGEVEFARGLLVNVQDKFEDRVVQRVEEARTEESSLQEARARADEERADLQARARVFGDMVNAFTIARSKLDVDSQKLGKLDEDLRVREARHAEERTALKKRAADLKRQQDSLNKTAADLEAQQAELQEKDRSLASRERSIAPKEQDLSARIGDLSRKEAEITEQKDTLAAAEAKLTADLEDYHLKARQAAKLDAQLVEDRKSLDELAVQIDNEEESLKARISSVEAREAEAAAAHETLQAKLAEIEPREQALEAHESELTARDSSLAQKDAELKETETQLAARASALNEQEAALAKQTQDLNDERRALDELAVAAAQERKTLDAKVAALEEREVDIGRKGRDLEDLKANLGPREASLLSKETDLGTREKALADERAAFQSQEDLVAAKAMEIQQQMATLSEREAALDQGKLDVEDAKKALERDQKDHDERKAAFASERERRSAELAAKEGTLEETQVRLTKETESFEAHRAERGQWIASKEIELEAKEQTLADREVQIRTQAEENARQLAELAAREETLEISADKLEKAQAELETRKAEHEARTRDLEAKTAKFNDEEARKGEELRTWQTTLESEQALLREQKETFEKEMQDLRESWAGRMIRVEQREEELKAREEKVQTDVEWVARNDIELTKREKTVSEGLRAAGDLKAEAERLHTEVEQRALEVESRERALREEAADQSVQLQKQTETLQTRETEFAGRKAQSERELATQIEKVKQRETELSAHKQELDAHEADLASREAVLVNQQTGLRQDEDRLARERVDLQVMQKQLESKELELTQMRERLDAESLRLRTETDAARQSLAAKEADLLSERERLERESSALQEKLGAKAKDMAAREKSLGAREEAFGSEEQELEARLREVESRERQTEARLAEIAAREKALTASEQEQRARRAEFDGMVHKFEADASARQQEWQKSQATLKSQEAQLAANAQTSQAEIRKRMENLEQRERSLNATLTQAQIERTRLEAQAKGQTAKQAEIEAAAGRSDKRFTELKAMEDELLKARQGFESEKAGWTARRNEELKQLEATRDAAGEQTQQAERLIEEAQRRAYVATEAEKAAKRQGEELTTAHAALERRRADAEKAEKDLEAQMAQLREASQRMATKEIELNSRAKELEGFQTRLAEAEKKSAETSEALKGRKAGLDREGERISTLSAELDKRQAEDETRRATLEAKLADVTRREQILTTELQRADDLMEDLNRKEAELGTREKTFGSREKEFSAREQALAQRDAELQEGMQTLERLRHEHNAMAAQASEDHRVANEARKEAEATRADAEKLKAQADSMQAEVSKNMRFLQKKALDVLDREEKIRARELQVDEQSRVLESKAQILERKDHAFEAEKDDFDARLEKAKQDNEKLKAKLAEAEKASKSTIDMDEWKRDIDNRVKIIQKKALDLLDREEKLRKKEEELRALAAQLGVEAKS